MILTFETKGSDIEIHFDGEGRDRLISLLQECQLPGDHKHLFRLGNGSQITSENFDEGYSPAESVTLWLLGLSERPAC